MSIAARPAGGRLLAGLLAAAIGGPGCRDDGSDPVEPGPLARKAMAYDRNHVDWHQSPDLGSRVETRFASPDSTEIVQYDDLGDSTFWSGQYVASQAFRYAVTGEEEARQNARRVVGALDAHDRVTGKRGFIGRFAGSTSIEPLWRYADPCTGENCHVVEDGPFAGSFWLGNTSRDQYTGWFYGMALLHDLVGDEDLAEIIRRDVEEVVDRLHSDGWRIIDVDGIQTTAGPEIIPIMQINDLLIARAVSDDPRWDALYEERAPLLTALEVPLTLTWPNAYFEYFGISLNFLAAYNNWRLEDDPDRLAAHVETVDRTMYPPVANTHQVLFDLVWMLSTGQRPPELVADVKQSLLEFPDAPKRRVHPEHPPRPVDPFSVVANDLFEALGLGEIVPNIAPRSIDPYPIRERCVVGDYWQGSPWALECGADDPAFEYAAGDYLQTYWMARYHGIMGPGD